MGRKKLAKIRTHFQFGKFGPDYIFGAGGQTQFAFSPIGRKLRFASVKPSVATLTRVAFRWVQVRFQQKINAIVNVSFTMAFIGTGVHNGLKWIFANCSSKEHLGMGL